LHTESFYSGREIFPEAASHRVVEDLCVTLTRLSGRTKTPGKPIPCDPTEAAGVVTTLYMQSRHRLADIPCPYNGSEMRLWRVENLV